MVTYQTEPFNHYKYMNAFGTANQGSIAELLELKGFKEAIKNVHYLAKVKITTTLSTLALVLYLPGYSTPFGLLTPEYLFCKICMFSIKAFNYFY